MRVVRSAEELPSLFAQAQQEAANAFSNGDLYCEKFIERPRHIEFQVLADEHGNVEVLGERECSIQRRHQKLIEESPSPALTPERRERMCRALKEAFTAIGYTNAGTVEFLMDETGELLFHRGQRTHPGGASGDGDGHRVDLVKAQLRVAQGERLDSILGGPVEMRGHAIECRINAEHPSTFVPSPGKIQALCLPGSVGIRVDTAVYAGGVIPPYYDSLVAKLIAHGRDREEAIRRMLRALDMFVVDGIHTSIPLHQQILADPEFQAGAIDTHFIQRFLERRTFQYSQNS